MTVHEMFAEAAVVHLKLTYPRFQLLVGISVVLNLLTRWFWTNKLTDTTRFLKLVERWSRAELRR